mgnify:CR=1 FL=1
MPVAVVDPPRTAGIGLNELILDGGLENGLHQVVGMGYGGELAGGDLLGVPGPYGGGGDLGQRCLRPGGKAPSLDQSRVEALMGWPRPFVRVVIQRVTYTPKVIWAGHDPAHPGESTCWLQWSNVRRQDIHAPGSWSRTFRAPYGGHRRGCSGRGTAPRVGGRQFPKIRGP